MSVVLIVRKVISGIDELPYDVVKNLAVICALHQYGTFELRIRFEFHCSNDVIVGRISLPHYRETVKSMFISCLLEIILVPVLINR